MLVDGEEKSHRKGRGPVRRGKTSTPASGNLCGNLGHTFQQLDYLLAQDTKPL